MQNDNKNPITSANALSRLFSSISMAMYAIAAGSYVKDHNTNMAVIFAVVGSICLCASVIYTNKARNASDDTVEQVKKERKNKK